MGEQRAPTTSVGSHGADRAAEPHGLRDAVLRTVAYADVFSFALTVAELHRYLIGVRATPPQLAEALAGDDELRAKVACSDDFVVLAGREELVERRRGRQRLTRRLWQDAVRYGQDLARLPFVEMVAVTGAVAVGNPEPEADLDYFIVTRPHRLWSARGFTIGLVRLAARRGDEVCPNYLLTEDALALNDRDLFTAHELTQMVPLAGLDTYHRMRELNRWTDELLPNAVGPPLGALALPTDGSRASDWAERLLSGAFGDAVERWEMHRKVRRLSSQATGDAEVRFSSQVCKGHFNPYGRKVLDAYEERLSAFDGERS